MKRFLIVSFILIIISACVKKNQTNIELDKTIVTDCKGKSLELILPKNWKIPDRYDFEDGEGFVQTYIYPDSSYIMVLCSRDKITNLGENVAKENKFARTEKYNDFSISYGSVKKNRKCEFDLAFEKMKKVKLY